MHVMSCKKLENHAEFARYFKVNSKFSSDQHFFSNIFTRHIRVNKGCITYLECCEKGEEESSKEEHQDQKDAHNLIQGFLQARHNLK